MSGSVIVLTGPPGAGKSTVSRGLAAGFARAVHLRTDDFWRAIVAGAIPPYRPESDAQNHTVLDVIAGAAYTYAAGGFATVVDGIVGPWMLDHILAEARRHPAVPLHYVVLRPTRDVALARAQDRTAADALVNETPIVTMWDQFADLGRFESHVLDTTNQDVLATVEAVRGKVTSGRMRLDR
jgi:predicted kinase